MFAYQGEDMPVKAAAKVIQYSRDIQLDKIAEIIGKKDKTGVAIFNEFLSLQDYSDFDCEQALRRFMSAFRMAGVESAVVETILEKFSHKFFEMDESHQFQNKNDAYEFIYIMIVLQTCQHNPQIKEKTALKTFINNVKMVIKNCEDIFPEGFMEEIYHKITKEEIKAPLHRNFFKESYNSATLHELHSRICKASLEDDFLEAKPGLEERKTVTVNRNLLSEQSQVEPTP